MESDFERRFLEGCLLAIISKGETYVFNILDELIKLGLDDVKDGSVYTILKKFEKMKLVHCREGVSKFGGSRKFYSLTKSGSVYLDNFKKYYKDIITKTNKLLFEQE